MTIVATIIRIALITILIVLDTLKRKIEVIITMLDLEVAKRIYIEIRTKLI